MQNMTLWPNMENMTFYDFVTLVIDFIGHDFCFKIRFIASGSTEKNVTFMTSNGPGYNIIYFLIRVAQLLLLFGTICF